MHYLCRFSVVFKLYVIYCFFLQNMQSHSGQILILILKVNESNFIQFVTAC